MSGERTTILFFGDSATRGYGVGRELRFPALVAAELAARSKIPLTFDVGAARSDFRDFRSRFESELTRVRPLVLVCQCPVGPACFFPRFPASVRTLLALEKKIFDRMTDRFVESEIRGGERTRHDALYEGRYLDRVNRWKPSNWPIIGPLWRARVRRYPTVAKITCEGYVERMVRLRDQARAGGVREILFLGLLPVFEDVCPGYDSRAPAWCAALRRALDVADAGSAFLDVHATLGTADLNRLLLRDRIHLSVHGHREVARLVVPALEPLLARAGSDAAG